jgi:ABC-type nitrate/sulfonate/bicarbonate transport system ATPase subunit
VLVLQEDALFPWLTGRDNIRQFLAVTSREIEQHELYPVVAEFIDRRVSEMSFGQRRSIELLRAVVYRPKALFLDEPFNYLDDAKATAYINFFISPRWNPSLLLITSHRHDSSLDAASDVFSFRSDPPYSTLQASQ